MSETELIKTYSATPGQVLHYMWRTLRKHWLFFATMFIVVCAASSFFVLVPVELKKLVDAITSQAPSASSAAGIAGIITFIVLYRLFGGLLYRCTGYMSARMVPRIKAELEEIGLRGVLEHSHAFFADQHTGSLVRRISRLSDAYERIHGIFYWNILGAIAIAMAITVQLALTRPVAAWLIVGWIAVISVGNWLVTKWKTPADEDRTRKQNASQGLLADIVTNATTVKLFAQEKGESRLFHDRIADRVRAEHIAWFRAEHGLIGTDMAGALLTGSLLFLALWGWEGGHVTVGDFVLLQSFATMIMDQLFFIGFAYRDFVEALTGASEIVGVLNSEIEVCDARRAKPLRVTKGRIEFSGVGFSYGGTEILSEFRLNITPREKLALIGTSGAGKTTVIKLLLRFYDVNKGKILIDGQDVAKVTQQSLRTQISLVPQDPSLFHRSLKENIAYGKTNVTFAEIIIAAKKARCHEFISKLPKGYDTLVGERGVKLSGGERQRIAIARAILADAPILVLDEATSSLDSESEMLIQNALAELMKQKTVIVIAHRLSTIMEMDRIIVMQEGKIVDEGTHDSLRAKVGIYQKLWNIQAGGFQDET